jgi:hypothetical protein
MQLRYLQTLSEIGKGDAATVLLPLPLDVITRVAAAADDTNGGRGRDVVPLA